MKQARRLFAACALVAMGTVASAEGETHKVAVHVDSSDLHVMNMALNNVANLQSYYAEQGDEVTVEVVTYGPGLTMLTAGSPVAARISTMSLEADDLTFSACANTMAGMEKKTGQKQRLLDEAQIVPSGVVRLIELQEDGYAYVRP
ncbi:DsrE family protein [Roseivivax marinus]|uniref:DsrE family protein n=1 Tax=Roseivivax marinus TaxID=1379903 RepID=UPI00273F5728|nr:DsrE family protein [Roseivivax marinus]